VLKVPPDPGFEDMQEVVYTNHYCPPIPRRWESNKVSQSEDFFFSFNFYSQCCGSEIFFLISDPTFFYPGSEFFPYRFRIKEFQYFNPQKCFLSSRKYDPGCSFQIPDPDRDFLSIPNPGFRIQGSKRHRIPDFGSRIRTLNTDYL
jgi:hypothetical protein